MDIDSTKAVVSDTLAQVTEKAQDTGWIMHHILDGNYLEFPPFGVVHLPELHLLGMDISITRHVIFMWLAVIILVVWTLLDSLTWGTFVVSSANNSTDQTIEISTGS